MQSALINGIYWTVIHAATQACWSPQFVHLKRISHKAITPQAIIQIHEVAKNVAKIQYNHSFYSCGPVSVCLCKKSLLLQPQTLIIFSSRICPTCDKNQKSYLLGLEISLVTTVKREGISSYGDWHN